MKIGSKRWAIWYEHADERNGESFVDSGWLNKDLTYRSKRFAGLIKRFLEKDIAKRNGTVKLSIRDINE